MIVPKYYEDLQVLHDGVMPARSYYIPASKRMERLVEHREESDRIQFLNGEWKFRYFESIYDVTDRFFEIGYDTSDYGVMPVPGVWQMNGYDWNQYSNIRYPFPFDPPYVPQDIPCGAYVSQFEYRSDANAPRAYLNFEGVDSCFYVWMNGVYIGYSQVSHATSEFDVTSALTEGVNTIAVLVLKWCDGSYLEDQDKFRMSGIYRDVYLLKRPRQAVSDYRITTEVTEQKAQLKLELSYLERPVDTKVTVYDRDNAVAAFGRAGTNGILLEIVHPYLWSAEHPALYTLVIETEHEVITDYVGFCTLEIRGNIIYLNGQKIKFHGVNRHDFDPVTGCAVSIGQVQKDLAMIKQYNFNAIRSSHYPNAPYFYQLCDKYGFMVMEEADVEAHGPFMAYYREDTEENRIRGWNRQIADHPAWEASILDRVKLMVMRDKNRPCILMWSMGNESAYGCNFERALRWTKEYDPGRITHYEGARYRDYDVSYDYSCLDLYSRMYPALEEIEAYMKNDASKPFLLVEYSHAMGNGPGDLEDYFRLIHGNDMLCGGFVWEWCDHAIDMGKAPNGKTKYGYGGDFGETIHDGNFCMDGLVYPDRKPHTGLLEYQNVHRPARVVSYDEETGELRLHNYLDFTDLGDYASVCYEVTCDGIRVEEGMIPSCCVPPHGEASVRLKPVIPRAGRVYLKITYRLLTEMPFAAAGHVLGFDEICLTNEDGRNQTARMWWNQKTDAGAAVGVAETDCGVLIKGKGFAYRYSKKTGLFESLSYGGREYLKRPMEINIWRAPTDNDRYVKAAWETAHYREAYARAYDTVVKQTGEGVEIYSTLSLVAASVQPMMEMKALWSIDTDGGILASLAVTRNDEFPALPRFGIRMFLPDQLGHVSYYGYGPMESYCDKHQAASHGLYRSAVSDLQEDYLRPQENGSHFDCDYVEVCCGQYGIAAAAERRFSFQALKYTQEELEQKAHCYELEEAGSTVLCLDYAQNGIGSDSCGPDLRDAYCFNDASFCFRFKLVPFVKA